MFLTRLFGPFALSLELCGAQLRLNKRPAGNKSPKFPSLFQTLSSYPTCVPFFFHCSYYIGPVFLCGSELIAHATTPRTQIKKTLLDPSSFRGLLNYFYCCYYYFFSFMRLLQEEASDEAKKDGPKRRRKSPAPAE